MITVFCDGACKKNPGVCGIGIVISKNSQTISEISEMIGNNYTNNVAEYCSVLRALEEIIELNLHKNSTPISVIMDSELVVKQLKAEYRVKQENLKFLHLKVKELISKFNLKTSFIWVPRDQNSIADSLANQGIEKKIQTHPKITSILDELDNKASTNLNIKCKNDNSDDNDNLNSSQTNQMLIAQKVFFSKTSCLKFQISKRKEAYIHIGSLQKNSWQWVICKFSDVELSEICSVIQLKKDKCAFYHKNSHTSSNPSTQIWCNSSEKGFSIKIQQYSKLLSPYESDVLYELMRRAIWEINKI